jgi:hypothetical protein
MLLSRLKATGSGATASRVRSDRRKESVGMAPLLVSIIAALAYGVFVVEMLAASPRMIDAVPVGRAVEVGGLRLTVESTGWVSPELEKRNIPLLPRTPAGHQRRLNVEVLLQNPGDEKRMVDLVEFQLGIDNWAFWPVASEPFIQAATLSPRKNLSLVLSYVVPETASALQLIWMRDGREVHIPLVENLRPAVAAKG